jgi:hypothetical protein
MYRLFNLDTLTDCGPSRPPLPARLGDRSGLLKRRHEHESTERQLGSGNLRRRQVARRLKGLLLGRSAPHKDGGAGGAVRSGELAVRRRWRMKVESESDEPRPLVDDEAPGTRSGLCRDAKSRVIARTEARQQRMLAKVAAGAVQNPSVAADPGCNTEHTGQSASTSGRSATDSRGAGAPAARDEASTAGAVGSGNSLRRDSRCRETASCPQMSPPRTPGASTSPASPRSAGADWQPGPLA